MIEIHKERQKNKWPFPQCLWKTAVGGTDALLLNPKSVTDVGSEWFPTHLFTVESTLREDSEELVHSGRSDLDVWTDSRSISGHMHFENQLRPLSFHCPDSTQTCKRILWSLCMPRYMCSLWGADVGTGSIKVKEGVLGSQWVPPWCRAKAGRSWQCQQKTWDSAIVTPGEFLFFFSDMGTFLKSNDCSCF